MSFITIYSKTNYFFSLIVTRETTINIFLRNHRVPNLLTFLKPLVKLDYIETPLLTLYSNHDNILQPRRVIRAILQFQF